MSLKFLAGAIGFKAAAQIVMTQGEMGSAKGFQLNTTFVNLLSLVLPG
ncbi:MAG: hypothetical protein MJA28_14700 [Gammaproteobacteria bacterium]|nr:hypothetical protein [Gammaproteobacteria bacterium]